MTILSLGVFTLMRRVFRYKENTEKKEKKRGRKRERDDTERVLFHLNFQLSAQPDSIVGKTKQRGTKSESLPK